MTLHANGASHQMLGDYSFDIHARVQFRVLNDAHQSTKHFDGGITLFLLMVVWARGSAAVRSRTLELSIYCTTFIGTKPSRTFNTIPTATPLNELRGRGRDDSSGVARFTLKWTYVSRGV